MKCERALSLFLFGVLFLALPACGKKGPPFLPKRSMPYKVKQLTCEWKDRIVHLKGHVVPGQSNDKSTEDVSGCRIYHAQYDLKTPPCEGCPIEYKILKEIAEDVITDHKFHCRVPGVKERGIHFFKVRLIGRKGAIGPSSNEVKLTIDDCLLKNAPFSLHRKSTLL